MSSKTKQLKKFSRIAPLLPTVETVAFGGGLTWLLPLLLLLVIGWCPAQAASARVVAVGDIHGDFDSFVGILQRAGIVDGEYRWVGGTTTLVQTGDFLDRGPSGREVMDLLMELEKSAPKSGGRVEVLLGNHEVMNLTGDLRYVPAELYSSFADEKSEKRRRDAYRDHEKGLKHRAAAADQSSHLPGSGEAEWLEQHPLGFVEYQKALAPRGRYGKWLRRHSPVIQIGDTVFLHGGIHPALSTSSVKELNSRLKGEIRAFDEYRNYLKSKRLIEPFFTLEEISSAVQHELAILEGDGSGPPLPSDPHYKNLDQIRNVGSFLIIHPEGPLWFRGFAAWTEEQGLQHVSILLEKLGARRFVVGHTPQLEGIRVRFGGRVVLIDTGMLSSYYKGGRASALEIRSGELTAIYLDGRQALPQANDPVQPTGK